MKTNLKDKLSTICGIIIAILGIAFSVAKGVHIFIPTTIYAILGSIGSLCAVTLGILTGKNSDGSIKLPEQLTSSISTLTNDANKIASTIQPALDIYLKNFPGKYSNAIEAAIAYTKDADFKKVIDDYSKGLTVAQPAQKAN